MIKDKLYRGEDKGEKSPSLLPLYEKIDQERLAQKIKTKNPKFTEVIEVRAYTLRCNVALPQAAYPFNSNQNKALPGLASHQKTGKGEKGKFPIFSLNYSRLILAKNAFFVLMSERILNELRPLRKQTPAPAFRSPASSHSSEATSLPIYH